MRKAFFLVAHTPRTRLPNDVTRFLAILVLIATMLPQGSGVSLAQLAEPFFSQRNSFTFNKDKPPDTIGTVVGDLDGDGDLDIVTRAYHYDYNNPTGAVMSFFNEGAGSFRAGQSFTLDTYTVGSLALGDLDNDKDLDILIDSNDTNKGFYRIYHNDGTGVFSQYEEITTGPDSIERVILGDLDGDGRLDIVGDGGAIIWNEGAEGWRSGLKLDIPGYAGGGLALGDLDGDGDLDVVTSDLAIHYQLEPRSFTGPVSLEANFYTTTIVLGDLNGDGTLDIATANGVIFLNQGQTFVQKTIPNWPSPEYIWDLSLGNLDADSDLDMVVAYGGQSYVSFNDGDGVLSSPQYFGSSASSRAVSLADLNNDRTLDIILAGEFTNYVYFNDLVKPLHDPMTLAALSGDWPSDLTMGDLDADDDLDSVLAGEQATYIYHNNGPNSFTKAQMFDNKTGVITTTIVIDPFKYGPNPVALGDLDNDGDLDIVTGHYFIHDNIGAGSFANGKTFGPFVGGATGQLLLGDMNSDGYLDIITNNDFIGLLDAPVTIFFNDRSGNFGVPKPIEEEATNSSSSMAIGDVDIDGDLDLFISYPNGTFVYRNDGNGNFPSIEALPNTIEMGSLALGDVDHDGDLDLAGYISTQGIKVYNNDGGGRFSEVQSFGYRDEAPTSIVFGDIEGDGDLDVAVSYGEFIGKPGQIYRNDGSGHFTSVLQLGFARHVSFGDIHNDGIIDLVTFQIVDGATIGYDSQLTVYMGWAGRSERLPNNPPRIQVKQPGPTPAAEGYASPVVLSDTVITIPYTIMDSERDPVREVRAYYSLNGGGQWLPAVAATGTITTNLATDCAPQGCRYIFRWDTFASGIFGQSDNVVIRLEAYTGSRTASDAIPGPFQLPYAATQSMSFRVRGTQVQVVDAKNQPQPGALVYRLPNGRNVGGLPIGNGLHPFLTDGQGYLQGRGALSVGDRLLALVPISVTETYTLYYTNGIPTTSGLDVFTVSASGVQTLAVSAAHPLLLFNLDVSLEWDASNDPVYLQQLRFDLQRASQYLYDFSDGQAALGRVNVRQNGEGAGDAEIVIKANNRLRPYANQGGVVITPTVDPQHANIFYDSGQVVMGATWNRYGEPNQNLGEDWPLTLAHELGHYLFFLDDVYLGINDDGLLVSVDTCTRSAMGDPYTSPESREFIADSAFWQANCAQTLTNKTLGRTEWETMRLWYPALQTPVAINPGPSTMPFDLTTVSIQPPSAANQALADPTFYLDYAGGSVSSAEARAYLIHGDTLIDLGSPVGGQNRVLARGAQVGDTLCVFDRLRVSFGCEMIELGDERLAMESDPQWSPVVRVTPVTSRTLGISVEGVPPEVSLVAQLYSQDGPALTPVLLSVSSGVYSATIHLAEPALAGYVRLWVDESTTEANPRRETVVDYSIGGNPGNSRRSSGDDRGGGGNSRRSSAPVTSNDGQLIYFTPNPMVFKEGDFYSVQTMAGLPSLPGGKTVIGRGYNLVASTGAPVITGSISIQYLTSDVLLAAANENQLTIHFWDGMRWRALPTLRDPYYNLVSARSEGPGIYTLLAGVTVPQITSLSPQNATTVQPITLEIGGGPFLAPVQVALVGATSSYTVTVAATSPNAISAVVPAGLPAGEYSVRLVNGDGGEVTSAQTLALYDPADARFYDFFESGTSRWQLSGEWGIVALPGGGHAMTDSPDGNYRHATPPDSTRTTSITSEPFSLDGLANPQLRFRHDYVLARLGTSEDTAQVEISTDDGHSWQVLKRYSGGGAYNSAYQLATTASSEWVNIVWKQETISLNGYRGTVQLRFSLTVDQVASDKGWLIDDVMVVDGVAQRPQVFLPVVRR